MGKLAHDRRVKLQQMRHKLKPNHRAEINQEHINRGKKQGTFSLVVTISHLKKSSLKCTLFLEFTLHFILNIKYIKKNTRYVN